MSKSSFGKPLKGLSSLGDKLSDSLNDGFLTTLSSGGLTLVNVNIEGGTINGVTQGNNEPGIGIFTSITSGNPSGQGYSVCFYGLTVGDSACWEPVTGTWMIKGDLYVRDISDLGNLRLNSNTISSTNTNGNIILDPAGSGTVNINSGLNLNTSSGNITIDTNAGEYTLDVSDTISSVSGSSTFLNTLGGDINFTTSASGGLTHTITFISSHASEPTVTLSSIHTLEIGDTVNISSTNSTPPLSGYYVVTAAPSSTSFKVSATVTSPGTTGSVKRLNNIFMNPDTEVRIPYDKSLSLGSSGNNLKTLTGDSLGIYSSGNLGLHPSGDGVTIDSTKKLILGDSFLLNVDDSDIELSAFDTLKLSGKVYLYGDTTSKNPTITLGDYYPSVDAVKDKGLKFEWNDGLVAKTGFFGFDQSTGCFTVIPNAVDTAGVFSGAVGCATFGTVNANTLNLQGGTITSVSTISSCNITCSSTMNISATNIANITSPIINLSGSINLLDNNVNFGDTAVAKDHGVIYFDGVNVSWFGVKGTNLTHYRNITETSDVISGTLGNALFDTVTATTITAASTLNISSTNVDVTGQLSVNDYNMTVGQHTTDTKERGIEVKQGGIAKHWFGVTDNKFSYLTNITNTNDEITGTKGDVDFGNTTVNDLTVLGNFTMIGSPTTTFTTEHLSVLAGNVINPSNATNITFIKVTSAGIATGTMPAGTIDGFIKTIILVGNTGGAYNLSFPAGRILNTETQTTAALTIGFSYLGQSISLIWNNTDMMYHNMNAGVCSSVV